MNKEDIIRMGRKAGGFFYTENLMSNPMQVRESVTLTVASLERFAQLVATAEREACAKVCDDEKILDHSSVATADNCANAIRARGSND